MRTARMTFTLVTLVGAWLIGCGGAPPAEPGAATFARATLVSGHSHIAFRVGRAEPVPILYADGHLRLLDHRLPAQELAPGHYRVRPEALAEAQPALWALASAISPEAHVIAGLLGTRARPSQGVPLELVTAPGPDGALEARLKLGITLERELVESLQAQAELLPSALFAIVSRLSPAASGDYPVELTAATQAPPRLERETMAYEITCCRCEPAGGWDPVGKVWATSLGEASDKCDADFPYGGKIVDRESNYCLNPDDPASQCEPASLAACFGATIAPHRRPSPVPVSLLMLSGLWLGLRLRRRITRR